MSKLEERMKKNKNKMIGIISVMMIIVSASIFPIVPMNLPGYEPFPNILIGIMLLLRIQMLYISFGVGKLIRKNFNSSSAIVFMTTFSVNAAGLIVRIMIEWGEASLMRDLTVMGVLIHLTVVPLVVLISYLKTGRDELKI